MCGVVLLAGPSALNRIPECLQRLQHRGPDAVDVWQQEALAIGFARLAINDLSPAGGQPYRYGDFVSAVNGEIFNSSELRARYQLDVPSSNDCHVIPALLHQLGINAVTELDGFFAGIVYDQREHQLYCLRDGMGKKPLFVGRSGSELFVSSELKALDRVDEFSALPSGLSRLDLISGELNLLVDTDLLDTDLVALDSSASGCSQKRFPGSVSNTDKQAQLGQLLTQAVTKRLPEVTQPLGVFVSGGLDSSIIAALIHQQRRDVVYYTLTSGSAEDGHYVQCLADHLGLPELRSVSLPDEAELDHLIRTLVYTTESFNPSIISNGLCTYLLARAARQDGLKVVLSGEGADELFGGYHHFLPDGPWRETRLQLLTDLSQTELRRVDLTGMAHGIETRCPFMDRDLINWALQLGYDDLYHRSEDEKLNKWILRQVASGYLPDEIVWRRKMSCDVGSGMRKLVVEHLRKHCSSERDALKAIWQAAFADKYPALDDRPYFSAYPVFDALIDRRGVEHK